MENIVVVGAGPCGLSAAIELQRLALSPLLIEKNCIVHAIYSYPTHLQFFSAPELLEIGNYPFTTPNDKPTRQEALAYYTQVARREQLRIQSYEEVTQIKQVSQGYQVYTQDRFGRENCYSSFVKNGSLTQIPSDCVLVLTGFRPDRTLFTSLGIQIDDETGAPAYDPVTMETNVEGVYVAGVVASSQYDANEIFIETGRQHGMLIAKHVASKMN